MICLKDACKAKQYSPLYKQKKTFENRLKTLSACKFWYLRNHNSARKAKNEFRNRNQNQQRYMRDTLFLNYADEFNPKKYAQQKKTFISFRTCDRRANNTYVFIK